MTRQSLAFALAVAASLAAAGAAAAATPIKPGYWESTNRILSPIKQSSTERRCITAKDVAKFMDGPSNRHYECTYPTNVVANGKMSFKGTCVSKKGRKVQVTGSGAYTPTSFTLNAEVAMEFLGLDITGRASTEAHRIGDTCPAKDGAEGAPAEARTDTAQ